MLERVVKVENNQSLKVIRISFILSQVLFFLSVYFMVKRNLLLFMVMFFICLRLNAQIPNQYAIKFGENWHAKEPLFFSNLSGKLEKTIFIIVDFLFLVFMLWLG